MDADREKIAADCWRKGNEAAHKQNWDYSIEMYRKSVSLFPNNLLYRQSLRGVERRKYNNNMTGARLAGMRLAPIRLKVKTAKVTKSWDAVDLAAEEGLTLNPWDAQLNADLGEACRQRGFYEIAIEALKTASGAVPDNVAYMRSLAEVLESRGEYTAACTLWDRMCELNPEDREARSKGTQLRAAEVVDRGGYEQAETFRDAMSDHEVARRLNTQQPGLADGPGMSVEADLKRSIRKEPEQTGHYLKLADFYRRNKAVEQAVEVLQQALQISGGDPSIREMKEDVELDLMRRNLEIAKARAANNADDQTAKKNAIAATKELLYREIEVLTNRVERYPADMRLKLELGQRLMRNKLYRQAIPLLQQSIADARQSLEALVLLGECFMADDKPTLARRNLERALEMVKQLEQPELFKKVHYYLGRLCEEAGERDVAEEHYHEVLAIDYEYRDALKRLEALEAGGRSA